jgi:hypothetical protein
VATEVITGKCQKSHTMVAADKANIANNAAIFVRERDALVMLLLPPIDAIHSKHVIPRALLYDYTVKSTMPLWAIY